MIELTHNGEALVADLLNRSAAVRETVLGQNVGGEWIFVPEIALEPMENRRFDVCALNRSSGTRIAIELKLGRDRLGTTEFARRFIHPCGVSHGGTRVTGSMVSILDGRLQSDLERTELAVMHDGQRYRVTRDWILVMRRFVLNRWAIKGRPSLSVHCRELAIEDLVMAFGEPDEFNRTISELIVRDFYQVWFDN